MIIKKETPNKTIQNIELNENTIVNMANHIVGRIHPSDGRKMSKHEEKTLDADGDGEITLKDFIHRIKNVAGAESRDRVVVESFEEKVARVRSQY